MLTQKYNYLAGNESSLQSSVVFNHKMRMSISLSWWNEQMKNTARVGINHFITPSLCNKWRYWQHLMVNQYNGIDMIEPWCFPLFLFHLICWWEEDNSNSDRRNTTSEVDHSPRDLWPQWLETRVDSNLWWTRCTSWGSNCMSIWGLFLNV